MTDAYDAVLSDLVAKRDAMNELIAALTNMRRLDSPLAIAKEAENVSQSVSQSVSTRTVPPEKRKPTRRATVARVASKGGRRRDTSRDDSLLAIVRGAKGGLRMTEIARAYDRTLKGDELDKLASSLFHHLKRLVSEKRLRREGVLYLPAAKEAP